MVLRISILLLFFSVKSIFSSTHIKDARQIKPTEKYDNIHVQKFMATA